MIGRRVAGHCGVLACALVVAGAGAGDAVAQPHYPGYSSSPSSPAVPAAATDSPPVTYTPMVRPGAPTPVLPPSQVPSAVPGSLPSSVAPVAPPQAPAEPWPVPETAYPPLPPAATAPALPWPAPSSSAWPAPVTRRGLPAGTPAITAATQPVVRTSGRRIWGLSLDAGLPDGLNGGLVVLPAPWLRLGAALGTNSASLEYRGGLAFLPLGWGPSFAVEAGHCNMAPTNSMVRGFLGAPSWVSPYVQEFGYTYFNAHLGFDLALGRVVLFLHGGYSYLMGTVRAPKPVVVDRTSSTTVTIAGEGEVTAGTLSGKLGLILMFGGS